MPIFVPTSGPVVIDADIAVSLGRSPSSADESAQWTQWIGDATLQIQSRLGDVAALDQVVLAYVVREAVILKIKQPDPITTTTTSVDDGSVSKSYEKSGGQIQILDEWWEMLDPTKPEAVASIRPGFEPDTARWAARPDCGMWL